VPDKSVLVLLSGGQDSTTCLALACHQYDQVETICFDYGQRHHIEIEKAKALAKHAQVSFRIIKLDLLKTLTANALTRDDIDITQNKGELPSTFVPGRNQLFLTVASIYAYTLGITDLMTGVCQTDYSGYPDCRETFIKSMQETRALAMDTPFKIKTPLMYKTKAETVQLMKTLGKLDWYALSHTCYEGKIPACGTCPACRLRLKGFQDAKLQDPLEYQDQN